MLRWLAVHRLDGYDFEHALQVDDGQGNLACYSPFGHKESDTAERLNCTELKTVQGFGIVSKTEVDIHLELSCFFDDPMDVGNLISGSSAFSKSSLNIWKFPVYVLLKPMLGEFEHYFSRVWDECNCAVLWTFFSTIFFLWSERKLTFSSPVATAEFSKCAGLLSTAF